eukprot:4711859-Alexandrium_andersonii.AAC.1
MAPTVGCTRTRSGGITSPSGSRAARRISATTSSRRSTRTARFSALIGATGRASGLHGRLVAAA